MTLLDHEITTLNADTLARWFKPTAGNFREENRRIVEHASLPLAVFLCGSLRRCR